MPVDISYYLRLLSFSSEKREHFLEKEYLLPFSSKSSYVSRRFSDKDEHAYPNIAGSNLTEYQKDITRIVNSLAFKKLERKSQIFIAPEGDYYRTRNIHSFKVSNISSNIARRLRLNEDLSTAIALGHDLGHTPFGHNGEQKLNEIMGVYSGGFRHDIQSKRIVGELARENFFLEGGKVEREAYGLNLTKDVIDGIAGHTKYYQEERLILNEIPITLEGQIVRIADDISYIANDINDAVFAEIVSEKEIPTYIRNIGENHYARINAMIRDCVNTSRQKIRELLNTCLKEKQHKRYSCRNCEVFKGYINEKNPVIEVSNKMKDNMISMWKYIEDNIHKNIHIIRKNREAQNVIEKLFEFYWENPNCLPERTKKRYKERNISSWFLEQDDFPEFLRFMKDLIDLINSPQFLTIFNDTISKDNEFNNEISKAGNTGIIDKICNNLKFGQELSYPDRLFKMEFFLKYPNIIPDDVLGDLKEKIKKNQTIQVVTKNPFQINWNPQCFTFDSYLRYKRLICDFIAGMTDRYALWAYNEFLAPQWSSWLYK